MPWIKLEFNFSSLPAYFYAGGDFMWPRRRLHGLLMLAFGLGVLIGQAINSATLGFLIGLLFCGCGCGCVKHR